MSPPADLINRGHDFGRSSGNLLDCGRELLGGGRDPHRLDASDGELVQTARHALASVIPIRGEPLFARLYRWTRGSPQFEVGHTRRLAEIETCLGEVPGLYVTGSGFHSIGIPDCIADARATAGRAAAYVTDTR